jgi:Na+-translocating ferredoxin:NAD+ oxidoreductase RnfD subunit
LVHFHGFDLVLFSFLFASYFIGTFFLYTEDDDGMMARWLVCGRGFWIFGLKCGVRFLVQCAWWTVRLVEIFSACS